MTADAPFNPCGTAVHTTYHVPQNWALSSRCYTLCVCRSLGQHTSSRVFVRGLHRDVRVPTTQRNGDCT